jgi:hypothetical protein
MTMGTALCPTTPKTSSKRQEPERPQATVRWRTDQYADVRYALLFAKSFKSYIDSSGSLPAAVEYSVSCFRWLAQGGLFF